ncbi:MAG: sulfotransferase family protein [Bacteroidales bacterium]
MNDHMMVEPESITTKTSQGKSKNESPIITFTRKLKEHNAFRNGKNKKMIYLIYFKLILSEPFRLLERKKYKKKLDNIETDKAPVFIIGHWRSGTTYMHLLLSQDPKFSFQNKYQNFFSDNFLTTEPFFKPVLSKFINLFDPVKRWKSKISKTMDLDAPSESDTALIAESSEFTYHWAHIFPKSYKEYFNKYLFLENIDEKELEEWKYIMRTFLNKIYIKNPNSRLLVKNPGDTARIKHLLDIYPGAKFIFLHRDPYEVFYSNLKLWSQVQKTVALQNISEKEKKEIVLNIYLKLHQRYLEDKKLLNSKQIIEISHKDLVENPLDVINNIYEKLELKGFRNAQPYFREYLKDHSSWKKTNYNYLPEDIQDINEMWNDTFQEWGYKKLNPDKFKK